MTKRIIQLLIILLPFVIFICLLWIDLCPSGVKEVSIEVGESNPYVYSILPDERVSEVQYLEGGDAFVTIEDEPTYFSVTLPHADFEQMEVELEFDSYLQPVVEIGGLADIYSESYDLKPLLNTELDQLSWLEVSEGETRLLQREHNFSSVSEFLGDLPSRDSIGVYHYDLEEPYRLSNYQATNSEQTINVSLRGYHKYLTYIKDEDFYLKVDYMDMNRTTGADDAVIRIRDEADKVVFEYFIEDDNNEQENQVDSEGTAIIDQPGWLEGVYSIELSGTSDMFWRSISTTQQYMTFTSKIYIADDVGYLSSPRATVFYTDAKHLTFETTHADSVQSVKLGSQWIGVSQSHEKYTHTVEDSGLVYGYSSLGDVKITGDGKFAFTSGMFFNPDAVALNAYSDIEALGIDYILTTYNEPEQSRQWSTASATFDVDILEKFENSTKFTISTPGLIEFGGSVDIHSITIRFLKDQMTWRDIISAIRNLMPFGI
ncbi:hypothetical protein HN358_02665 [Candidatus Uhrbacteria bacterium]|jgi:hypothetical protein|nr:hypothetical protein [Candidatus Uhrbacteria bacterium]MBT7717582.1 hypothetical protein [Candidatus Uhrbacteria bacterium]